MFTPILQYIGVRNYSMKKNKSIGIFDSGFGGLSTMKGILKKLPEYNFIYLGDTARAPYGNRSKEVIYNFTVQAVNFLFKKNCELIILACNTVSSDALRQIQQRHIPRYYPNKKVLGVTIPLSERAVLKTKNGRVGVMGTERTVASKAFVRELRKINPKIKVFQKACPLLVPIVEAGEQNSKIAEIAIEKYIKPLAKRKIDTLILGCTHYGLLENKIKKIVEKNIEVVSDSEVIAKSLKKYLERHPEIEKNLDKKNRRIFYSTDLTKKFQILGSKFFGKKIEVKKIDLE